LFEEEKIREKKKSLYLACLLERVHPSPRKPSFIKEKKNRAKERTSCRIRKDSTEEEKIRQKIE